MIKRILNEARKSLIMGIAFAVGAISTTAIAITVSTTFNPGDTLTASALNELKEVLVKLPNFTTDASGNALLASGNVGIGITDPTEKLEVDGTIKATNFIIDGTMAFSNIIILTGSTPNISGSNVFKVTTGGTITNFLGGVTGQEITIIIDASEVAQTPVTVSHGIGKLNLEKGVDFTQTSFCGSNYGGVLKLIYDGTSWHEVSRSENRLPGDGGEC